MNPRVERDPTRALWVRGTTGEIALDDAAAVADAAALVARVAAAATGAPPPRPVGGFVSRWADEPFVWGSYSHTTVRSRKGGGGPARDDRDALARGAPDAFDGRLIIAGEATCRRMFATVHGAFVSGLRAARDLLGDARAASRADWRDFLDERTIAECDSRAPAPADGGVVHARRRRAYRQLDALLRAADK